MCPLPSWVWEGGATTLSGQCFVAPGGIGGRGD